MIIDVSRLAGRLLDKRFPTGVDRVDIEYIRRYGDNAIALIRYRGRWLFFSSKESKAIFNILIDSLFSESWKIRLMVTKRWWLSWISGTPTHDVLLNISHSGLDDPAYARKVAAYGLRAYYFIHDCIPLTHPEYSRIGETIKHQNRLMSALSARGIIVNSYDTKEQLKRFVTSEILQMPPVAVAHLGYTSMKTTTEKFDIPNRPYFVAIGTIEGRKNHLLLLNVWRKMAEQMGESVPKLLIIGQRGWESENAVDMIERCERIYPHIEERKRCADAELKVLLKASRALLFPSFVEGYGLPLIEAMANGVPVIASNLNVFHEIAGNIPEYLDPIDGIGWMNTIMEYSQKDSFTRNRQFERMKEFKTPTWDDHFKQVEKVFLDLNTHNSTHDKNKCCVSNENFKSIFD